MAKTANDNDGRFIFAFLGAPSIWSSMQLRSANDRVTSLDLEMANDTDKVCPHCGRPLERRSA